MNDALNRLRQWCKHGLAAFLFLFILLGGCAGALLALAGTISAISNDHQNTWAIVSPDSQTQSVTTEQQPSVQPPAATQGTVPNSTAQPPISQTPGVAGTGTTTSVASMPPNANQSTNNAAPTFAGNPTATASNANQEYTSGFLSKMHSPVGDVINHGGVVLGNAIGHMVGSVLAGALQTLFLQQADENPSASSGPAQTQTQAQTQTTGQAPAQAQFQTQAPTQSTPNQATQGAFGQ